MGWRLAGRTKGVGSLLYRLLWLFCLPRWEVCMRRLEVGLFRDPMPEGDWLV